MLSHLKDAISGKAPLGARRSAKWPFVRKQFLAENPTCARCGGVDKLEVHHVLPFHLHPELELEPGNLVTLCESGAGGVNCHLAWGHLGNFKRFNPAVRADAAEWLGKLAAAEHQEAG